MTTFAVPVPGRRQAKAIHTFEAMATWATDIDIFNVAVSESFQKMARAVTLLTTTSTPGVGILPPHAFTHAPGGSDAILTGVPVPVGSVNDAGTGLALIRNDHIHQGVHSLDAGGTDLYGDVTFAASGTSLTVNQVGQTITYTLASGGGSGLDADTLDGIDSLGFLVLNAPLPLGTAWDAGNFAITLGSIVGKSGNLAITAATGGNITFENSIASAGANVGFTFSDTILRAAGASFRILNSAGDTKFGVNASASTSAAFTFGLESSAITVFNAVWLVTGTHAHTLNYHNNMLAQVTTTGSGPQCGALIKPTENYTGAASTLPAICGMDIIPNYLVGSTFGNSATTPNKIYGINVVNGYTSNGQTNINAWGLQIGNAGTPSGLARWAGLIVNARPTGVAATSCASILASDTVSVVSGIKIGFDGTFTAAASATQGSTTFTAYTEPDTYLTYNSGSTQLDCFVDGAQAFHFDAGGAAGTNWCYGNLRVDGITQAVGNLQAYAGVTVITGNVDVQGTGNILLVAGNRIEFDGTVNYAMLRFGTGIYMTVGGPNYIFAGTSLTIPGNSSQLLIGSPNLTLSPTVLTLAPTSAGTFVMTLKDALQIINADSSTARKLVQMFWNQPASTGTKVLLEVLDQTNTYLAIQAQRGLLNLSKYAPATAWLARKMSDLAGTEWVWDFDTDATAIFTTGGLFRMQFNGGAVMTLTELGYLDCVSDVRARQLVADGDSGGIASTVTFTKTNTAVSGATPATLGNTGGGPAAAAQSHWLKFYDGTTTRYIPVWT